MSYFQESQRRISKSFMILYVRIEGATSGSALIFRKKLVPLCGSMAVNTFLLLLTICIPKTRFKYLYPLYMKYGQHDHVDSTLFEHGFQYLISEAQFRPIFIELLYWRSLQTLELSFISFSQSTYFHRDRFGNNIFFLHYDFLH